MRLFLRSLPQMLVIAGIVTTALFVPIMAILAFLSFVLFGVPLRSFVTFGEALTAFEGLSWCGGPFSSSRQWRTACS